jgi:uncharacterized protein Yka (UPF0111/DUF47 family)
MDKDRQDRHSQLMQAAKDAAFEAAEAMDRGDVKTWNELQDRAAALRKEAGRLKSTHAPKRVKKGEAKADC